MSLKSDYLKDFTIDALIRAMVPIGGVIKQYKYFWNKYQQSQDKSREEDPNAPYWTSIQSQEYFANLIIDISNEKSMIEDNGVLDDSKYVHFSPSTRYLKKLVMRFISLIEGGGYNIEDATLSELLFSYLVLSSKSQLSKEASLMSSKTDDGLPNPMDFCHVSFFIPNDSDRSNVECHYNENHQYNATLLGIRVFPFHNDVGVRKVWEAGCCLAEFFLSNPNYVHEKHVLELGAGVGLTGMIVAACCGAKSVHMTDYTNAVLSNLEHNVQINRQFFQSHSIPLKSVTSGYLEWGEYSASGQEPTNINESKTETNFKNKSHDLLIAADVVYDRSVIPVLIAAVQTFLRRSKGDNKRLAIFATSYRNEKTFEEFMFAILKKGIKVKSIPPEEIHEMKYIFPCYNDQPRSDTRIHILSCFDFKDSSEKGHTIHYASKYI